MDPESSKDPWSVLALYGKELDTSVQIGAVLGSIFGALIEFLRYKEVLHRPPYNDTKTNFEKKKEYSNMNNQGGNEDDEKSLIGSF